MIKKEEQVETSNEDITEDCSMRVAGTTQCESSLRSVTLDQVMAQVASFSQYRLSDPGSNQEIRLEANLCRICNDSPTVCGSD